MKPFVEWFSRNHLAANFLMWAMILAGVVGWFRLRKEIFPDLALDVVMVRVPYPNASPEEVEKGVCVPIEEAVQDLNGIKKISSICSESMGFVMVEVKPGFKVRDLMADVKSRVDAIDNFAQEAEKPVVEEFLLKNQIMSIAITADTDEATLRGLGERVRDDLLSYQLKPPNMEAAKKAMNCAGVILLLAAGLYLATRGQWTHHFWRTMAFWCLLGVGAYGASLFFQEGWQSIRRIALDALAGTTRISQVKLANARNHEIGIEVSEATLRAHGLTLGRVANAVRASSLDLPAGSVRTEAGEILIRTQARRYRAPEFESITVVTRPDGSTLSLGQIAKVVDGFEEVDLASRFNGKPALIVNVYRTGEEDTLRLVELARSYVKESANSLPPGVKLEVWNDFSVYLKGRMDLMFNNGFQGFVLVVLVLGLFLQPKLAWYVSLGIPISIAGGLLCMPYLGVSINMISLFAFILVLGVVVDDAIVIGENVFHRMKLGEHPRMAAPRGTNEVAMITTFGVLTTVMAFTPMLMVQGVSGKIWSIIPFTVIPTLLLSTVESKLILPAHLATLKPLDPNAKLTWIDRIQNAVSDWLDRLANNHYQPLLKWCLARRYAVTAAFVALLVVSVGAIATGWIKTVFFPIVEADMLSAKLQMEEGTPFATTQAAIHRVEEAARQMGRELKDKQGNPVFTNMLATSGAQPFQVGIAAPAPLGSSHIGEVTMELSAAKDRHVKASEISSRWRELVGDIPGAQEFRITTSTDRGGRGIELEVSGNDLAALSSATETIKAELRKFAGVETPSSSDRLGKREIKLRMLPTAEALDLRLADVSGQVRQAFYGEEAQRLQRGRDEIKVMVRYPRAERESLANLAGMKIRTPRGEEAPFSEVAVADFGRGFTVVNRTDRRRSVRIIADVDTQVEGANANFIVGELKTRVFPDLAKRFPGIRFDFEGEQKDQNESVRDMGVGFIFALFGIYVLLAIPLKSYVQPFLVMAVIPFGIVGAIVGHLLLRMELSIMSMCGCIALAGMVVNESLILTDRVNRIRQDGVPLGDAAWQAGLSRFRSIMATSVTTFVGLVPIMSETDIQALFLVPMSVALGFGGLFATMITLLLVPCLYVILEDLRRVLHIHTHGESALEDVKAIEPGEVA